MGKTNTGVTVKGFVNGHIVFSDTHEPDEMLERLDIADVHIKTLLKYVGPDDVCYLELHFHDDDTYLRIGTDRSAMVDPQKLDGQKTVTRTDKGWKVE